MRSRRIHSSRLKVGILATAGLLAGCQAVLAPGKAFLAAMDPQDWQLGSGNKPATTSQKSAEQTAADGQTTAGGKAPAAGQDPAPGLDPAGGQNLTSSQPLVSPYVGGLTGTVVAPDSALIGNNSANLADVGGGVFLYRIQELGQKAVEGAVVTLVDAAGKAVSAESAKTDAAGRFAFKAGAEGDAVILVQATFQLGGQSFVFQNPLGSGQGSTDSLEVDAASTLLAAKVRVLASQGALTRRPAAADVLGLRDRLRSGLNAGNIPFMRSGSPDILHAFEQQVLDVPEIAELASRLTPQAAVPAETWQVTKVADSYALRAGGALPVTQPMLGVYGPFEVDAQGNVHFLRIRQMAQGTASFEVARLLPDGGAQAVVTLPANFRPPLYMTFGPDGSLYVGGFVIGTGGDRIEIYHREGDALARLGTLVAIASTSALVDADTDPERLVARIGDLNGRIAADSGGNVYAAFGRHHVVVRLAAGSSEGLVFAGSEGLIGNVDGPGRSARFNFPSGLALGPDGAVYVADRGNNCIRRVTPDGTVSTYAGKPGQVDYRNGRGAYARFDSPESLAIDAQGNVVVTDSQSRRVRRLSPNGSVFLVAGTGAPGFLDGPGHQATFGSPRYLAIDAAGNLYVQDIDRPAPPPGVQPPQQGTQGPPPPGATPPPPPREYVRKIARPTTAF